MKIEYHFTSFEVEQFLKEMDLGKVYDKNITSNFEYLIEDIEYSKVIFQDEKIQKDFNDSIINYYTNKRGKKNDSEKSISKSNES